MAHTHVVSRIQLAITLMVAVALVSVSLPSAASAATSGGWTSVATATPASVASGDPVSISVDVASQQTTQALVDVEVYNEQGAKVHQRYWDEISFRASVTRTFETSWDVPRDAPPGLYTVKVGVFRPGWRSLLHWNDEARTVRVVTEEFLPGTHQAGGFTTRARASTQEAAGGDSVEFFVVTTADTARAALVDLEVYGPTGAKVFQRAWDNVPFGDGVAKEFTASWNVPSDAREGTYAVKVGVFAAGWNGLLHWNDGAEDFDVVAGAAPSPPPAPSEPAPTPTDPEPSVPTAGDLPGAPAAWPSAHLELGMGSQPGDAAGMMQTAPFGFRYQYLAGGVNTGNGWAQWNPNGSFVTNYIEESRASGVTPVFTYYMLFQSNPGVAMGEPDGVYANLRTTSTMAAYFRDLKLFFERAGEAGGTTVFHVEPDLWAFMQQQARDEDARTVTVRVGSTGVDDVAGLADNAAGLAQAVVRLRDKYAPNVLLGYHFSSWGTGTDVLYADPSDEEVERLGSRTAAFYQSLGANFDIAFTDIADRDAGFKEHVYGDGGASWMDSGDYHRSAVYIGAFTRSAGLRAVLWQLPFGNTKMRAMNNTRNHYQDNKVEWLLDEPARTHLGAYADAGVVAFLFGMGAGEVSCACDASGDGVTNPAPINGNTRMSLTADDDGGFFRERAANYYESGALMLPR